MAGKLDFWSSTIHSSNPVLSWRDASGFAQYGTNQLLGSHFGTMKAGCWEETAAHASPWAWCQGSSTELRPAAPEGSEGIYLGIFSRKDCCNTTPPTPYNSKQISQLQPFPEHRFTHHQAEERNFQLGLLLPWKNPEKPKLHCKKGTNTAPLFTSMLLLCSLFFPQMPNMRRFIAGLSWLVWLKSNTIFQKDFQSREICLQKLHNTLCLIDS